MRNMNTVALTLILVFALTGCGQARKLPLSWGHPQIIYVFASDEVWAEAEIDLHRMLARDIYTTQNEQWFKLKRADMEHFEDYFRFDNLLFLGSLDSENAVTEFMQESLGADVEEQVKRLGEGVYSKNDQWAKGQIAVFFLSETQQNLTEFNHRQSAKLFDTFRQQFYDRLRTHVYLYNTYDADVFFADWPWTLDLPDNYVIYKQNLADNFACYFLQVGDAPERYLAVWFEQTARPADMKAWMKQARNYIGAEYFAGEKILPTQSPRLRKNRFAEQDAWQMNGHWINDETITGGAFQSWGFYDDDTGRAYLVDTSVFYPEGKKLPPLVELELIARTFRLKQEADAYETTPDDSAAAGGDTAAVGL
ncbi:MAG: DUF4837 family protein [Candidatus Cloacimonetes bacterium]|nr:DUF4837 family protein [Candidatus Cloacimonadota bacterium]